MATTATGMEALRRPGEVVDGRFVVERTLGSASRRGAEPSAGLLVRAWDRSARATVALRTGSRDVDPRHFLVRAEARAAALHPAFARFTAFGEAAPGRAYVATEWVDGEDLGAFARKKPLTLDQILELVRRLADGILVLHRRGAAHGSIALNRVIVPGRDLGRAKLVGLERALFVEGPRPVEEARDDVYGLALVIYRALGGDVTSVVEGRAAPLRRFRSDLPAELDELLSRALAKEVALRPEDIGSLLADLETLELIARAPRTPVPPRNGSASAATSMPARLATLLAVRSADAAVLAQVRSAAEEQAVPLRNVAPDTVCLSFSGDRGARLPAERAARFAAALRMGHPPSAMSLATGCEIEPASDGSLVLAAALAQLPDAATAAGGAVRLDAVTARLVESRFELVHEGPVVYLHQERQRRTDPPGALRSAPFVGRDRESALVDATFSECTTEQVARSVVIRGAGGIGKTRLVQELVRRVESRGTPCEVWTAHADPLRQSSPFGVVAQLASAAAGMLDGEAQRAREIKLKARVSKHVAGGNVPWVAEGLAEICGSGRIGTADLSEAWSTFVSAECLVHPLLLVVENLQWTDAASLRLLERTCLTVKNVPLLLLLTERTEGGDARELSSHWNVPGAIDLPLGELPRSAMGDIVAHLTGEGVGIGRAPLLADEARGNVRALLDAVRDPEGTGKSERIRAERRFARVSADAQRLLALGSVFGLRFLPGVLARYANRGGEAFVAARSIDELGREELIHETPRSPFHAEPEYAFRDLALWEAASAALGDEERRSLHGYLARWLENAGDADAGRLAEHYRRSGNRTEADRVGLLARALSLRVPLRD